MAPNMASIAGVLRQTVQYHLNNFAYENALFFAERLQAHDPRSPESAYLLALCHLRLGDARSAYEVSRSSGYRGTNLGCAFVFAQACLELERYKDGITALEKSRPLWAAKSGLGKNTPIRIPYPDAAAASCLLGKLYRAYNNKDRAVPCFEEALAANPFMWDAFTILCDMAIPVRVPNIFKTNDSFSRSFLQELGTTTAQQNGGGTSLPPEPPTRKTTAQSVNAASDPFVSTHGSRNGSDTAQPPNDAAAVAFDTHVSRASHRLEPPQAPPRRTRAAQALDPGFSDAGLSIASAIGYRLGSKKRDRDQEPAADLSDTILKSSSLSLAATERKRTASGHPVQPRTANGEEPRRSARLNMPPRIASAKASSTAIITGTATTRELKKARPPISRIMRPGSSGSSVGRVVSGNRKPLPENIVEADSAELPRTKEPPPVEVPPPKPIELESAKVDEALRYILDLLKRMATGYQLASQFQCQEALNTYALLPRSHQDTPWVLAQMGRAQYEQASYVEAEKLFRRLRILAPTRLEDMEVYSTILWHLRKETDLSFLAHELVDAVWDSPQAWCALGNAWSLACDHDQALRCFKRATQLDPKFAYAYTLQGHEHVENEEYDKALTAYRHAISAEKRHYNAYYGIGRVYEKLGNYEKALSHYHSASMIHPTHAVLICCMGSVLQRQKQTSQALLYFTKATELAPRAPDVRLKKARALLGIGQLQAAQKELMMLKDLAPDRAQVHFLLGKLAKTLRDKKSAVRHFTIALSLDPKASLQIKEAIESLEEDDDGLDEFMMH
ncbi:hypothetical protein QBC46DRAFT_74592 [Diplogelasinospora grovesii]|uniref:Uncharacterized protein n=1 Tax=Diplogelasinospora grovesii TaxID=303347 RepID=A0AAN6S780_9PEZI|nr:hypothetical protein QBC46DRAFT_74592 [Diplogelasinospora grovesii]